MAKVKSEKIAEEQNVPSATEQGEETPKAPEVASEDKVEVEIPETVKQILKLYPNMKELYIDTKGGVYTKSAPAQIVKGLTLYKNPYFKQ